MGVIIKRDFYKCPRCKYDSIRDGDMYCPGRTVTKMPANRPSRTAIEKKAIEVYTKENQVIKTMEELGELTQALAKWLLCQSIFPPSELKKHILEEVADVQIMLDQLKMIFGTTLIEEDAKLTRLAGRLEMMEDDNGETR